MNAVSGEKRRKIQRWVYSKKVSSWGSAGAAESVLYSPHVALVLSGLGRAVLCRAGPVEGGREGGKGGGGRANELLRRVQTC